MDWKSLFFSAEGRIGPKPFWIGWVVVTVVGTLADNIPLVGWVVSIIAFAASICVYGKRLHDMGRTAWLLAAPYVVGTILVVSGFAVGAASGAATEGTMTDAAIVPIGLWLLAVLVWFGFTLWCGLTPGEPEKNRFGRPPGERVAPDPR